jgi:hypothetical protein
MFQGLAPDEKAPSRVRRRALGWRPASTGTLRALSGRPDAKAMRHAGNGSGRTSLASAAAAQIRRLPENGSHFRVHPCIALGPGRVGNRPQGHGIECTSGPSADQTDPFAAGRMLQGAVVRHRLRPFRWSRTYRCSAMRRSFPIVFAIGVVVFVALLAMMAG